MPLYKSQVEKIVVYVVESKNQTGWADFNPVRIRHLICKMAAEPLPQAAPTIPCPTVITVLPTKISKKSCHV
uniref:Uncharacterized protein n=1 Tax=Panagrolaimus superbus TaxID=310955 RepID=A0A914Z0S4_9BILA